MLESQDCEKKYEFKGSYNASSDMKYWYTLDLLTGILSLGNISYNFIVDYVDDELQVLDLDVMEFRLIKMPFNTSYICTNVMESDVRNNGEMMLVEKNKYNFVNMNGIPNTYDIDMFGKSLVRTRKKKINSK